MAAKDVKFSADARERILGVDVLANAVKVTLGPEKKLSNLQSAEFRSYGKQRGCCGDPVGLLLGEARFAQPDSLGVARLGNGLELFRRIVLGKELRLEIAEGRVGLLAGFTVCLCHEFPLRWP